MKLFLFFVAVLFPIFGFATSDCASLLRADFDPQNFYWDYPSDHLPAAGMARLDGTSESFPIVSWNVLNSRYLKHILSDSQGLLRSGITATTNREVDVLQILGGIISTSRPGVVGLQEVDVSLLHAIQALAFRSEYLVMIANNPDLDGADSAIDFGVVLVDSQRFIHLPELDSQRPFQGNTKYVQQVGLKLPSGPQFVFLNLHRHGKDDETLPVVYSELEGSAILVGDFNYARPEMAERLAPYSHLQLMPKPPSEFTHINTRRILADYDHLIGKGEIKLQYSDSLQKIMRQPFRLFKP